VCVTKLVNKLEFVGNCKRVAEFKARAFRRSIADRTPERAFIMKKDASGFPGVRAFVFSAFNHHSYQLA